LPLLGLFVLIVLGASALLYHGFELPAQKWLNRRGPRRPHA
jgi:peptidoglycan/LPS O-acetylase OafA/YrhL